MHHRIASFDGQAIHLTKLAAALRELGCDVRIVGPPVLEQLGAGTALPAVDLLRRRMPDPVYEGLEFAYSGFAFLRLLWAWLRFKPDVIYERFNLFQPAGLWLRRLTGTPLLVEVNAPLFEERDRTAPIALRHLGKWSERYVLAGTDRVLPVSRSLARLLQSAGVPPERITVVPNGADLRPGRPEAREETRRALGLSDRLVIGFLGFVRDWNRLDRPVDLVAREGERRNLHLLVIGDGPGLASAGASPNSRLTVTGAVAPERVADLLAAVDIAVHPGGMDYASPIKIFEYMAQARAIVAPDRPNIREILDEDCALLFDPDDPAAFDAAVLRLCGDPALRRSLGSAARARLADLDLTWRRAAEQVRAIALEAAGRSVAAEKTVQAGAAAANRRRTPSG